MFAVIGVVTVFQGLVAVCVNETGPILYRPSLLEKVSISVRNKGHRKHLVVSYWMSGAVSSRFGCRVATNIAMSDGRVYCWSVPCRNAESRHCLVKSVSDTRYGSSLIMVGTTSPHLPYLGPNAE